VGDLYGLGLDVKLLLTTQTGADEQKVSEDYNRPFVELRGKCGRKEFHAALPDGDFSLCYIDFEGTGLAYLETVISGMTPIFVRRPWLRGRMPDDYRFYVDAKDLPAALKYAADHPKESKKHGRYAVEYCRQVFSARALGEWWSGFLDECLQNRVARVRPHFTQEICATAYQSLPGKFSKPEAIAALINASERLKAPYFQQAWPSVALMFQGMGARRYAGDIFVKRGCALLETCIGNC
jgi:hypothetical protein